MKKRCSRCRLTKPRSEFYVASRTKDGIGTYCKTCQKEWQRERYWRDPQKYTKLSNQRQKLAKYGLTPEALEELWESGGGLSALSGTPIVRGRHQKNSGHIDHFNDLNGIPIVRGLISHKENTAIGLLDHDPELCIKAAQYLYKHQVDLRDLCTT